MGDRMLPKRVMSGRGTTLAGGGWEIMGALYHGGLEYRRTKPLSLVQHT